MKKNSQTNRVLTRDEMLNYLLAENSADKTVLFNAIKENKPFYYLSSIDDKEIEALIKKHYYPSSQNNFNFFYADFPQNEQWRRFVDVKKQKMESEGGWKGYEQRGAATIQNMYEAACFIEKTIDEPLTTAYIKQIHEIAMANAPGFTEISGWGNISSVSIEPGKFKEKAYGTITLDRSWVTPVGYMQMAKYMEGDFYGKTVLLSFPPQGFERKVNALIERYENEVKEAIVPLKKLKAIVRFTQALDRAHPFKDGNTRVFQTLLLNRELIRHGFTPTLLEDPNRFQGYSLKEAVLETLFGMENFTFLKANGNLPNCKPTALLLKEGGIYPIDFSKAFNHPLINKKGNLSDKA